MAIQTIDLRKPGGDTPRSANTKINANFTNQDHAASRQVGTASNQIPLSKNINHVALSGVGQAERDSNDLNECLTPGRYTAHGAYQTNTPLDNVGNTRFILYVNKLGSLTGLEGTMQIAIMTEANHAGDIYARIFPTYEGSSFTQWAKFYTTKNTTTDGNGFIKASSPVLRVFSDKIEGNDDGDKMQAEFIKNGIGDYLIKNTTGLADEGWYIELPQDANKNPLVAVDYKELKNGDISVKTYKRIFDMSTFMFAPDYDNPLDIPDGRWIDLRFNDLPTTDEPIDEV